MIRKLIEYFEEQLKINNINCDFLGEEIDNYSIEPISSRPIVRENIDGSYIAQYSFCLASRKSYTFDKIDNIVNNNFGMQLMNLIIKNNQNGILPEIDGIESIEVTGTPFAYQTGINTARYQINMKIEYLVEA